MVGTKELKAETFHTEAAQRVKTEGTHKLYMIFSGSYETGMAYGYNGAAVVGNAEILFAPSKTGQCQKATVTFNCGSTGNYVTHIVYYTDGIYVDNISLKYTCYNTAEVR